MKKTLLSIGAFLMLVSGTAQTQIFMEDFEGGAGAFSLNTTDMSSTSTGYNDWVVNNSYTGGSGNITCVISFAYTINNTDPQPAGISSQNGNYAHILADQMALDGVTNAGFRPADGTCEFAENYFMTMTNDVNTTAFTNVGFNFWWLGNGGAENYGELYYSTDGGTTWTQETTTSSYTGQDTWTQETLTNAAWDGQAQLRFGFRFVCDVPVTILYDPSFSVDDIEITGTPGSCSDSFSSLTETTCLSYTVPSGDETYTTPGNMTVMDTILNVSGCDSIMTIDLTINGVDTSVTASSSNITSNATGGATYQWLDCNLSHAVVTGETNASIGLPGVYAVEVTENGCVDTSSCYTITLSIDEFESNEFTVFPNPSAGSFSIDLSGLKGVQKLTILDTKGSIVMSANVSGGSVVNYEIKMESGIYIVQLVDQHGTIRRSRLMVE